MIPKIETSIEKHNEELAKIDADMITLMTFNSSSQLIYAYRMAIYRMGVAEGIFKSFRRREMKCSKKSINFTANSSN